MVWLLVQLLFGQHQVPLFGVASRFCYTYSRIRNIFPFILHLSSVQFSCELKWFSFELSWNWSYTSCCCIRVIVIVVAIIYFKRYLIEEIIPRKLLLVTNLCTMTNTFISLWRSFRFCSCLFSWLLHFQVVISSENQIFVRKRNPMESAQYPEQAKHSKEMISIQYKITRALFHSFSLQFSFWFCFTFHSEISPHFSRWLFMCIECVTANFSMQCGFFFT